MFSRFFFTKMENTEGKCKFFVSLRAKQFTTIKKYGINNHNFLPEGAYTMKSTGIVRKVDELGRIVLPIEMRRTLDIAEKDALEIYVEGDSIILRKYQPACIFCDNMKNVISFQGKNICSDCLEKIKTKF